MARPPQDFSGAVSLSRQVVRRVLRSGDTWFDQNETIYTVLNQGYATSAGVPLSDRSGRTA